MGLTVSRVGASGASVGLVRNERRCGGVTGARGANHLWWGLLNRVDRLPPELDDQRDNRNDDGDEHQHELASSPRLGADTSSSSQQFGVDFRYGHRSQGLLVSRALVGRRRCGCRSTPLGSGPSPSGVLCVMVWGHRGLAVQVLNDSPSLSAMSDELFSVQIRPFPQFERCWAATRSER